MRNENLNICEKCYTGNEPPVRHNKRLLIPKNVCMVCYIRYGKLVPATRHWQWSRKNEN